MKTTRTKGRKYLVGWGAKYTEHLYSDHSWTMSDRSGGVNLMTYNKARKYLKKLGGKNDSAKVAIYEVVPVFKMRRKDLG